MCNIYSHADPILYECRARSVRINGVITTIRLENLFWQTLSDLAGENQMTTNQLIAKLHDEVSAYLGAAQNFASFLRVTCLRYLALKTQAALVQAPSAVRPLASTSVPTALSASPAARLQRAS